MQSVHNESAKLIQKHWKRFILQKKIWYNLKPKDLFSIKNRNRELDLICKAWKRIHFETTHFRTFIITYSNDLVKTDKLQITLFQANRYSVVQNESLTFMNKRETMDKLKKTKNIVSIKIEATICDWNVYGYPEKMQINLT
jgi:hypothetical protein